MILVEVENVHEICCILWLEDLHFNISEIMAIYFLIAREIGVNLTITVILNLMKYIITSVLGLPPCYRQ